MTSRVGWRPSVLWLLVALAPTLAHAAESPGPSVAVFALEAKTGVGVATAQLLTEDLVDQVRQSKAFGRVVSSKELESTIGFEQQRQMLNCSTSSCMAEIAGALNVDFLLVGSVGKLGETFFFNVSLISVKTSLAAASVAHKVKGETEQALVESVGPALQRLLLDSGLKKGTAAAVPEPAPRQADATPAPASSEHGSVRVPLVALGGVAMGASALLAVTGVVLLAAAGTVALNASAMGSSVDLFPVPGGFLGRLAVVGGAGGGAAVAALLGLAALVAGGAMVAAGVAPAVTGS